MNVDDRIGEWEKTPAPFCRDRGWMRGWVGAWCLSCWPHEALGCRHADEPHPNEHRHQAPASTQPRPLSLQIEDDRFLRFPVLIVHVHQDDDVSIPLFGRQHSLGADLSALGDRSDIQMNVLKLIIGDLHAEDQVYKSGSSSLTWMRKPSGASIMT
jgi:hypothetical protein